MDFSQMKEQLRQSLQPKRFEHSVAVSETAVALARHYGVDEDKAALAGLLHDCARKYPTKDFVEVSKKLGVPLTDIEKAQPSLSMPSWGPLSQRGTMALPMRKSCLLCVIIQRAKPI